jgi:hypothetical protein
MATAPAYTAKSGVAQKGPLIQGSTVTAQELDSALSPTGQQFSYQILTNFGAFSPTSTFTSQYLGLIATGYYFDEVADTVSTGPITLNAYSDLTADSVLNVNLLTTLEYQRIQNLVTQSNMTFAAARAQAETEVLAALNIPAGSYGSFDSLNLTGSSDGDYILAAISSLFVYGNSAGPLSALIASFQSDIGSHGVITNPATTATLVAAAKGINPPTVAANLTQYYASQGLIFTAANISDWIAQSGDGVIGRDAFSVPDATPSTAFTFPSYVVSQFAGLPVSVTAGQLTVNGTAVSGTVSFNKGDTVAVSPGVGSFPNGVLTSYLVTGKRNLARVSFVSGLVSIAVTPSMPSVPLGVAADRHGNLFRRHHAECHHHCPLDLRYTVGGDHWPIDWTRNCGISGLCDDHSDDRVDQCDSAVVGRHGGINHDYSQPDHDRSRIEPATDRYRNLC